jgi:hypothetical protein
MTCFKRLVMAHINSILPDTLDPLQFAYRPNRSIDDAISIALHTVLSHLDKRNTYVRMLIINYSSAFNTIVHTKLITKLRTLGLNTSLCNWILDFLTGHPQEIRVGNTTSAMLILNTGAPLGCVLSPLLYLLFTHEWLPNTTPTPSLSLLTTQVVGLITDNDETAYWEEVRELAVWCQDNDISLNVSKTKELIVYYRKRRAEQAGCSGAGREFQLQVPWDLHHQRTIMVQTHQDSLEEGTTKPFFPQQTEKIWHGPHDPQKVLQLHHQKHPDRLHHRLVWQLLGI